jgi:putative membrane protein
LWAFGAVAGLMLSGRSSAAPPQDPGAPVGQTANAKVVSHLHAINLMEIDAGKVAETHGQAKAARDFGALLVHDHDTADQKLMAYAKRHGIDPDAITDDQVAADMARDREAMERVGTLSGAQFDREFGITMKEGHEKAIAMVEEARGGVSDPRLRSMLNDLLPTLRKHLDIASTLATRRATAWAVPR